MIIDAFLLFTGAANAGNFDTPTTGTQNSTNVIDLHMAGIPVLVSGQGARDIGIGDDPALKLLVQVGTAFTTGTTLQVVLQGSVDNGSGAPLSFTNWWLSPAYAEATLVAGARLYDMDMPRPPAGVAVPRFLRLGYISTGTHTTGSIFGAIVIDRHDQMYQSTGNAVLGGYPAGITVSN
jgi:Bbp16